jgi:O-antigen ligase
MISNPRVTPTPSSLWLSTTRVCAFLAGFSIATSTALLGFATLGLLLAALNAKLKPQWREALRQPFIQACVALWLTYALSAAWSSAPAQAPGALVKLYPFLIAPALFAVFRFAGVAMALVIGCASGIALSVVLSIATWLADTPLMFGLPGDWAVLRDRIYHNMFAGWLVLGCLVLLLTKALSPKWRRIALVTLVLTLFDIYFLVQGRTGHAVLLILMCILLVLWDSRKGAVLALLTLVLIPTLLWLASDSLRSRYALAHEQAQTLVDPSDLAEENSIGLRLAWLKGSWEIFGSAPWFGHGAGSLETEFRRVHGVSVDLSIVAPPGVAPRNPHNSYAWLGVEVGVCGILVLLGVFAAAIRDAWQRPLAVRWSVILITGSIAIGSLANSFIFNRATGSGFVLLICALLAWPQHSSSETPAANSAGSDAGLSP